MIQIDLFDQKNIHELEWPNTDEAEMVRRHFLPMLSEGVQAYIQNVETQLYLLKVNSMLIPITVNHREYDNSYLTSNYFPIRYLEEQVNKCPSWLKRLQVPFLKGVGLFLKSLKINKIVIINNWLLTTNIYPNLSDDEWSAVTVFLAKRFADHTLIFKSLNAHKCSDLTQCLEKQNYRFFYARHVCIYDPKQKDSFSSKVHYHHRRDRRLIGDEGYEIVRYDHTKPEEVVRFLQLYNCLYLTKHTTYSPQYTEKFLKEAVEKRFLNLVCLKKKGEIKGVIGFHERSGMLIAPFCGYDHSKNDSNQLYRMLTILAIDEAEKRKLLLNDGSGGEAPKQYRGMKTFPEYIALYVRHLPFFRRFFWVVAEKMINWLAVTKINNQ